MFYNTFNNLSTSPPEMLTIDAEIITLSAKNKIEIKDIDTNHFFLVRYPTSLLSNIKELHISELVKVSISKITLINNLTKKEKIDYNLIEINRVENL
ncbi:hypothetical protein [Flavobacterium sp. MK4S-17]|uniref:hypothetical protein n=1 Tax=Flavobacterium sp. MK4S-17 TaxID=2543737 RepID=UPI00135B7761|nr:hypothetical protein [Flavobacterium sp. MK4S-17]